MLKDKIELLVERLGDSDLALREFALKELKNEISSATSSITSVPKPLKFLFSHYPKLRAAFEEQRDNELKVSSFRQKVSLTKDQNQLIA